MEILFTLLPDIFFLAQIVLEEASQEYTNILGIIVSILALGGICAAALALMFGSVSAAAYIFIASFILGAAPRIVNAFMSLWTNDINPGDF